METPESETTFWVSILSFKAGIYVWKLNLWLKLSFAKLKILVSQQLLFLKNKQINVVFDFLTA